MKSEREIRDRINHLKYELKYNKLLSQKSIVGIALEIQTLRWDLQMNKTIAGKCR